jgi:hypothetical protein
MTSSWPQGQGTAEPGFEPAPLPYPRPYSRNLTGRQAGKESGRSLRPSGGLRQQQDQKADKEMTFGRERKERKVGRAGLHRLG